MPSVAAATPDGTTKVQFTIVGENDTAKIRFAEAPRITNREFVKTKPSPPS
jgi:hypothetical protein